MPRTGSTVLLGYSMPELHKSARSGWYIDFYANHPKLGVTRYKRKVNKPKDLNRRAARARDLIREITHRLQTGWRPWDNAALGQGGVTIGEALDRFDKTKVKQLRHSSPYSYTSMTSVLREWCMREKLVELPAQAFNRNTAVAFLNYADEERRIGNRTYNNYLGFFLMVFNWQVEQGMRLDNPFKGFSKRKKPKKTRTYLTVQERMDMAQWIKDNDPDFWLAVIFIYGSLIRPGELKRLRVRHVDLDARIVFVPAEESKSGDERSVAIPDWMHRELMAMGLQFQPSKSWLIGSRIVPGPKCVARNTLGRRWVLMRDALGWPENKQLYSLRDTGIIQLIRDGVDLLSVRDQAGHTDLSTTNAYVKHAFPNGPAQVREKATPLQASTPIIGTSFYRGEADADRPLPRFANMERQAGP